MAGTSLWQHNVGVFDKLNAFVYKEVDKACKDRTTLMRNALRYRKYLEGVSGQVRYPKGDGSKNKINGRAGEPHSFKGWRVVTKGPLHYTIYNDHKNSVDDFPYPNILAYGMDPNKGNAKWVRNTDKIVSHNGKFFSRQMPKGLFGSGWMEGQRKLLIAQIELIGQVYEAKMKRRGI